MRTNTKTRKPTPKTHEGGPAVRTNAEQQLRRSVMANLLWESTFYEDGVSVAKRIADNIPKVSAEKVAAIAIEAREQMKLRHVPLLIVREMARLSSHRHLVADTLTRIIQRPDEICEFVSLYWADGKQPLSKQVKLGLANAFNKFDEYQFAKWDKDRDVKLRDVMFLVHPNPVKGNKRLFKKIVDGTLKVPDTWEVSLSRGEENKADAWTRLVKENKLGAMAVIFNLRNMIQAGVKDDIIRQALANMKTERVLPYRFITAARYAPQFEPELEDAMYRCLENAEKLSGDTAIVIDVSYSMAAALSSRGNTTRMDAACGLGILAREMCEHATVYSFSNNAILVPSRRGFALRDAIQNSQSWGGTNLGAALNTIKQMGKKFDRIIVITDEQSHDRVTYPANSKAAYCINVATYQNGVGYGKWVHIDGWSESVLKYILEYEKANMD